MAGDDEIIGFILRSREKRRTDEQIVRALLSVGWKKERVESAFRIVREKEFLAKQDSDEDEPQQPEQVLPSQPKAEKQELPAAKPVTPQLSSIQPPQTVPPQQAPQAQPPGTVQQAAPASQQQIPATQQSQQAQPPLQQAAQQTSKVQAQPVGVQQQPQAKKSMFSFPNIFGKKPASSTSATPAQLSTQPQGQTSAPQLSTAPLQAAESQPAPQPGTVPSAYAQPKPSIFPPAVPAVPKAQQPAPQSTTQPPKTVPPAVQQPQPLPSLSPQPEPKSGAYMKPMWPSDSSATHTPFDQPYQKVSDESNVKNPAFAKIEQEASRLPENKFLPIVIVAFAVLLAVAGAAYYFVVLGGSAGPRQQTILPDYPVPAAQNISNSSNSSVKLPVAPAANNSSSAAATNTSPASNQAPSKAGYEIASRIAGSATALPQPYKISYEQKWGQNGNVEKLVRETVYVKGSNIRRDTLGMLGPTAGIEKRQYALGGATYDCIKANEAWSCGNASYRMPPPAPLQFLPSDLASRSASSLVYDGPAQISEKDASCFNETTEKGYISRFCLGENSMLLYSKNPYTDLDGRVLDYEITRSGYVSLVQDSEFILPLPPPSPANNTSVAQPPPAEPNITQLQHLPEPTNQTTAEPEQKIVRTTRHVGTGGESVLRFCRMNGGFFLHAHYTESWGADCHSSKNKEGFANQTNFPPQCEFLYCCVNDPSSDFSRGYDYFECGYYEYG